MDVEPARLLVVDDDELNRDVLSRRLRRRGFEVVAAEDGATALQRLDAAPFDLVLLDVMMPGMSGLEVLRRIRATRSTADLPVIMATARSESADIVEALELGANDYVTKPLDFAVVLARVNTQVQLKGANDRLRAAHARMKQDLDAAARVQRSLLPTDAPPTDRARFAWAYRPCDELGGDALNVFPLREGVLGLFVLDVSGHGVPAALLSVTVTRSLTPQPGAPSLVTAPGPRPEALSPAAIASRLNTLYPMASNGDHYFTLLYGVLDLEAGTFRFVCAGHPGPVLVRPGHGPRRFTSSGFPVGLWHEADYADTVVELQAGDRLYLHSDGLTEEMNAEGRPFDEAGLMASLARNASRPLDASVEALLDDVVAWRGSPHLGDDVSILAVELGPW